VPPPMPAVTNSRSAPATNCSNGTTTSLAVKADHVHERVPLNSARLANQLTAAQTAHTIMPCTLASSGQNPKSARNAYDADVCARRLRLDFRVLQLQGHRSLFVDSMC
jgi:hypothetical protein